jgi:hypothetical protein
MSSSGVLVFAANVVYSSVILFILMMEALSSSDTSVLTRDTASHLRRRRCSIRRHLHFKQESVLMPS